MPFKCKSFVHAYRGLIDLPKSSLLLVKSYPSSPYNCIGDSEHVPAEMVELNLPVRRGLRTFHACMLPKMKISPRWGQGCDGMRILSFWHFKNSSFFCPSPSGSIFFLLGDNLFFLRTNLFCGKRYSTPLGLNVLKNLRALNFQFNSTELSILRQ